MAITSASALTQLILDSQLLEPAQTRELTRSLQGRFQEPKALARELVQRGWLTAYQINKLFHGCARELALGPYVIEERLGEGGMGQVFRARHKMLNRRVALKVIRKERLADPDFVRRFYREIQAAAQLSHANIVVAYDADHVGDTHFFAMEFVDGIDLCRLVHEKGPLPIAAACDFIRQAALGLQHAFEHGMVHRDIKPSNLLVTRCAGKKSKGSDRVSGRSIFNGGGDKPVVKILDMGLVRIEGPVAAGDAHAGELTQVKNVLGTPDFIAPEQARDARKADIRADLYSLGCTFYYLLTGQAPFPGDVAMEKLIKHWMEEPQPIEELRPETPPAVTAIVRKLMAKQPENRFQTPAELAVALATLDRPSPRQLDPDVPSEEFIALGASPSPTPGADTTIAASARADTATSVRTVRLRRTDEERRRWLLINVGGGVFLFFLLLVLVVVVVHVWPWSGPGPGTIEQQSPEEKAEAALQALRAQVDDPQADVETTRRQVLAFRAAYPGTARAAQALGLLRKIRSPLDRLANKDIPLVERFTWQRPELVAVFGEQRMRQNGPVQGVALSGDGALVLSGGGDRILYVRDGGTDQMKFTLKGQDQPISAVAVTTDGTIAATANSDGMVHLWDVKNESESDKFLAHAAPIRCLAFSHDGKMLATGSDDKAAKLWDVSKKKELFPLAGHAGPVRTVAFSADDAKLATLSPGDDVHLWDASNGKALPALPETVGKAVSLAFAPAGPILAIGIATGGVKLWDLEAGKEKDTLAGPAIPGLLAFVSKGSLLAVTQGDAIQLWEVSTKQLKATLTATPFARVVSLGVDRDGGRLAVGDDQGAVRVFDPVTQGQVFGPSERWTSGTFLALSPTDRLLVASSNDLLGKAFDAETGLAQPLFRTPMTVIHAAAFSPDGQTLLLGCDDATVRLWDLVNKKEQAILGRHGSAVMSVAFSPDGTMAASGGRDGFVFLWDLTRGHELSHMRTHGAGAAPFSVTSLAFSPDGKLLASASKDAAMNNGVPVKEKVIKLWNVEAGGKQRLLEGHTCGVTALAWSPDGKNVAAGGEDGTVRFWDTATSNPKPLPPTARAAPALSLTYHPETGELLAAGEDGKLIFWNPSTGKPAREWLFPAAIQGMSLSVDGRHLAVSCWGSVYLFRLSPAAK
jgi:serine/threonine-protein kinase